MTGYGHTRFEDDQFAINVEVKTLNSKFLDVNIRIPRAFSDKEMEIRNLLGEILERGKINLVLDFLNKKEATSRVNINEQLFSEYFDSLNNLADGIKADKTELFKLALQFPEVMGTIEDDHNKDEEWKAILPIVEKSIRQCDEFRIKEGDVLTGNLLDYKNHIATLLEQIKKLDPERIEKTKKRLKGNLSEFISKEELDVNRMEQELIYYIEKLDINEEIVRLDSHLAYFSEILQSKRSMGKKLNFIAQEMGREINTIGSKSNYAPMQKLVVNMKEELEKIKEQVLNLV